MDIRMRSTWSLFSQSRCLIFKITNAFHVNCVGWNLGGIRYLLTILFNYLNPTTICSLYFSILHLFISYYNSVYFCFSIVLFLSSPLVSSIFTVFTSFDIFISTTVSSRKFHKSKKLANHPRRESCLIDRIHSLRALYLQSHSSHNKVYRSPQSVHFQSRTISLSPIFCI